LKPADFIKHSFKVMQEELNTVKVRISPAWARWMDEKVWHESQRGCWAEGCGLEPGLVTRNSKIC
jgi:hypothetical protein